MPVLTDFVRRPDTYERLRAGRGAASAMMVYRGGATGDASCDLDDGAASPLILNQCLDEMESICGMSISDANVFCSEARTTVTVKFAIPGVASDIAFYYDTCTDEASYQILHREEVHIRYGSQSDLLATYADPEQILVEHYGQTAAQSVRAAIRALGLTVSAPVDDRMDYDTYAFPLEPVSPD